MSSTGLGWPQVHSMSAVGQTGRSGKNRAMCRFSPTLLRDFLPVDVPLGTMFHVAMECKEKHDSIYSLQNTVQAGTFKYIPIDQPRGISITVPLPGCAGVRELQVHDQIGIANLHANTPCLSVQTQRTKLKERHTFWGLLVCTYLMRLTCTHLH